MATTRTPIISKKMKKELIDNHKFKLGGGHCGEVFLSSYQGKDLVYKEFEGRSGMAALESEIEALEALASAEGVPRILGINYDRPLLLVMSYCGEKNLDDLLQGPKLPDRVYLALLSSAANSLFQIHACNHVHNDLKLDNIVIGENPPDEGTRAYIVDFSLARAAGEILAVPAIKKANHKTLPWMPPENFHFRPCQPKGDVWSLGYLIHQVLQTNQWEKYPKGLHYIVNRCLVRDCYERADLHEVMEILLKVLDEHR